MVRQLYIILLALHPARFRYRFAFEMLAIFDEASAHSSRLPLLCDAVRSLVRQWVAPYTPVANAAVAGAGVPLFHSTDPPLPKRHCLMAGAALSLLLFSALATSISRDVWRPRFSAGAYGWIAGLFSVSGDSSQAGSYSQFPATSMSAQDNKDAVPRPEIRGVVLEPGSQAPVAEAEVTLEFYGETRLAQSRPASTHTTTTDINGSFVFHPDDLGRFNTRAKKEGYTDLRPYPGVAAASSEDVRLSAAAPSREVRLFLARPAQLAGLVVSGETAEPVANVRLGAIRALSRGVFLPAPVAEATSDAQGKFVLGNLAPGDYAVEILPRKLAGDRVQSSFSPEDAKAVDRDFEHTYWPGGGSAEAASPVSLVSGGTVDVGVLHVKTTGYYRVRVSFPGWDCEEGDVTKVYENKRKGRFSSMAGLADVPCGRDLLVSGFPSGAHRLVFGLKTRQGGTTGGAAVPFAIGGENLTLTAPLERPLSVNGAIVAADGAKLPDLSAVVLRLSPASNMLIMDLVAPAKADATGRFLSKVLAVEAHALTVSGLGSGNYVKEVRYNGVPVSDNIVPLSSGALAQELTVVLDDKPALITGTAVRSGKPVSRPVLVLVRWPLPSGEISPRDIRFVAGDDTGRFQIGGLAPGEYRLIAVTRDGLPAAGFSDLPQRALAAARKIELGGRAIQDVTIELTELR